VQNMYQLKHMQYRDTPLGGREMVTGFTGRPQLLPLWKYQCDLTDGRTVCAVTWNNFNQDLLGVAYTKKAGDPTSGGLVLVWSLDNPGTKLASYLT
jgi:hypothetical protein